MHFGGRLSLVAGGDVATTDQVGKTALYYAPSCGAMLPVISDGQITYRPFLASPSDQIGLSLDMAGDVAWPAGSIHDVFALWDGTATVLATRMWDASMLPTEEQIAGGVAITTGTGPTQWDRPQSAFDGDEAQTWSTGARIFPSNPAMANFIGKDWGAGNAHAISRVEMRAVSNNFLLGTGSSANLVKIWGSNDNANWNMLGFFYADCSVMGNVNSFPINVSNRTPYRYHRVGLDGDPGYSINIAELRFYREAAPASGRKLTRFYGVLSNDAAMTARTGPGAVVSVPAGAGVYLGTIKIDAAQSGRLTVHTDYGPARACGVWNAWNRKPISLRAGIITPNASSYVVNQLRWGPAQGADFSISAVVGLPDERVEATFIRLAYINAQAARKAYEIGIGVDTTSGFSGAEGSYVIDTSGQAIGLSMLARVTLPYFSGSRKLFGIERADSGAGVASGTVDQRSTVLQAQWMG